MTPDGQVIRTNFSCPKKILDTIDKDIIPTLKKKTGYHLQRSRLIYIFFNLIIEVFDDLDMSKIYDDRTFEEELKATFQRKRKPKA